MDSEREHAVSNDYDISPKKSEEQALCKGTTYSNSAFDGKVTATPSPETRDASVLDKYRKFVFASLAMSSLSFAAFVVMLVIVFAAGDLRHTGSQPGTLVNDEALASGQTQEGIAGNEEPGVIGIKGTKGDAGDPGSMGPQGPEGDRGLGGLDGMKGDTGEREAPGLPGLDGLPGSDGSTGMKGDTGERGAPGLPGLDGLPGSDGSKGLKGDTGQRGTSGIPGRDGYPGADGLNGLKGVQGDAGPSGPRGASGMKGDGGVPGVKGQQGNTGQKGAKGASCSSGVRRIRLVGGSSRSGRIEVFVDGRWGTVCDDNFGGNDASVACRQLGYSRGSVLVASSVPDGTLSIVLDGLACSGTESSLQDCGHNGAWRHDCSHSEDVGVTCQ